MPAAGYTLTADAVRWLRDLRRQWKRVPQGKLSPDVGARTDRAAVLAPNLQWVRLTSATLSAGRYPGVWLTADVSGAVSFADQDAIWVIGANGETLQTGKYYLARMQDFANGRQVFAVERLASSGDPVTFPAGTTADPSANLPTGVAPTSPDEGDLWGDASGLHYYAGGIEHVLTGFAGASRTVATFTPGAASQTPIDFGGGSDLYDQGGLIADASKFIIPSGAGGWYRAEGQGETNSMALDEVTLAIQVDGTDVTTDAAAVDLTLTQHVAWEGLLVAGQTVTMTTQNTSGSAKALQSVQFRIRRIG